MKNIKYAMLASVAAFGLFAAPALHAADDQSSGTYATTSTAKPVRPSKETTQGEWSFNDIHLKASTGFDYSSGSYGQPNNTDIWYVPFTGALEFHNWTVKLTLPWVTITGPGSVRGAGDSTIVTGAPGAVTTNTGLGDMVGSLAYTFNLPEQIYFDATGKVKFPTGDVNRNLGTGEYDYTLQGDLYKQWGKVGLFGGGGHRFTGDQNVLKLRGIWLGNIGASYDILPQWTAGAVYDWRESATALQDPSELTPYVNYKITDKANIEFYGDVGFSNGSPDYGGGLMIGYKVQ